MKIILGLGNPGLRFRASRHNLGFLTVEALAGAHRIKIKQRRDRCLLGKGKIATEEVILGFPLTLMNLSGEAVAVLVKQNEVELKDLLIVCDDIDLGLGKIRMRSKGTAGGHNGLKYIIELLGSDNFPRLRIGVGRPKTAKLTGHVLGRFNKQERKVIDEKLQEAVSSLEIWIKEGIQAAMNEFN